MKKKVFIFFLLVVLFFDIWFSDGYPQVLITLLVGVAVYRFVTPYLRI